MRPFVESGVWPVRDLMGRRPTSERDVRGATEKRPARGGPLLVLQATKAGDARATRSLFVCCGGVI